MGTQTNRPHSSQMRRHSLLCGLWISCSVFLQALGSCPELEWNVRRFHINISEGLGVVATTCFSTPPPSSCPKTVFTRDTPFFSLNKIFHQSWILIEPGSLPNYFMFTGQPYLSFAGEEKSHNFLIDFAPSSSNLSMKVISNLAKLCVISSQDTQ